MKENFVNTAIRLPQELVDRIEKWREAQMIRPSLTRSIRFFIEKGLETI